MSLTRIKVENLSKQYRLGEVGTGTLAHDLNRFWHKMRGNPDPYTIITEENDRTTSSETNYVWALKNINFEVKKGEVLGIIGKNGAGKSTLLKLLSKVTGPTQGEIKINGRIGSLLEVGTGMHPELTGRENIFLNGAILGMTSGEVKSKFQEIVEFAGISRYVDTPFKRYSSGMRVRLGFAVAAFLEPEILIVDEVLAVGDAEFQKKCVEKMKEVASNGRTVLFVSHNMPSVLKLCSSAIVLENGEIAYSGTAEDSVNYYLKSQAKSGIDLSTRKDRLGNAQLRFTGVSILNNKNEITNNIYAGEEITIKLQYKINELFDQEKFALSLIVYDYQEQIVASFPSDELGSSFDLNFNKMEGTITLKIDHFSLRPHDYYLSVYSFFNGLDPDNYVDTIHNIEELKILNTDYFDSGIFVRSGNYALMKGKYL